MKKPHTSETHKLIELVAQLCQRMDRPVCSNDLKAHFRENPAAIPLLQQRLGQVLIKAAPIGVKITPSRKLGLLVIRPTTQLEPETGPQHFPNIKFDCTCRRSPFGGYLKPFNPF